MISVGERVENALARADEGEGPIVFTQLFPDDARNAASDADRRIAAGEDRPLEGLILSVKDLFDVAGQPTWAGSHSMRGVAPAKSDAPAVRALRDAGAILIGKTVMTEFAFSGLGLNPHFGTPRAPFDRATGRIPGGSSSGAAVSIADRLADIALGSDTGGSARIPAAYCGLAGFKPTQARVSRAGMLPLSPTLDCVGWLARDIGTVARVDAVLAGRTAKSRPLPERIRIGVIANYVRNGCDAAVRSAFAAALDILAGTSIELVDIVLPELDELPTINGAGGFAAIESYRWHKGRLPDMAAFYDPQVLVRIERGAGGTDADIEALVGHRARLKSALDPVFTRIDALLVPTVPIAAPLIAVLSADPARYHEANALVLRNPSIANFLDWCSVSLPIVTGSNGYAGVMLFGPTNGDGRLLAIAEHLESCLRDIGGPCG